MRGARSVWRARAGLFAVLAALLVVNAVILVSYRYFYDDRFRVLVDTRQELEKRRDEALAASEKAKETEKRLASLRDRLEGFYNDTLGSRRERLAPLIEEVYSITRSAGLRPDAIAYAENDEPGADRIQMTFAVSASYTDIKRLLAAFESNPHFLILEAVTVGTSDTEPDVLKVGLGVSHYFRGETSSVPRRAGSSRAAPARPSVPRTAPAPTKGRAR